MDALLTLVARAGCYLVSPIGNQLSYLYNYHKNTENLKKQVEKLSDIRKDVEQCVSAAKRNGEVVKITVSKWLEAVQSTTAEAHLLINKIDLDKRCLKGCSPDWIARYHLSREAFEKTLIVMELQGQKPVENISITEPPLNIEMLPDSTLAESSAENVPSGSSTSTVNKKIVKQKKTVDEIIAQQRGGVKEIIFHQRQAVNQIFDALQDKNCKIIRIYGMGGIGKTTLAKEIGKMAEACGLFNKVVFAVVSRNLDIRKVQGQIGDMLGVYFREESETGRAGRLFESLIAWGNVLIVLDDVWASVNFKDIGVPLNAKGKGCKILITTRLRNICGTMGLNKAKEIPLRLLSEEESWNLFTSNAGLLTDSFSPGKDDVTMKVSKECGGLPLAVVTVGRALRNKGLEDWTAALQQLKKSKPLNINDGEKDVFSCLKLSYDNLKSEEAKECFLLCCLFPEDHDIKIEDIARYGLGKGLFTNVDTMEEARRETQWIMRNLTDCCLLLDSSKGDCVRMHDMVRDFAISIASKENYGFLVKAGLGLKEWPNSMTLEHNVTISLMSNRIKSLPDGLICPRLEILLLGKNEGFEIIPDGYFKEMKMLRVLDLSEKIGIRSLNHHFGLVHRTSFLSGSLNAPSSFEALVNLRTLHLDHCKLDDIAILGKLKRLEILSLYGCDIQELPGELGQLVNLRLLDLNFCQSLRTIPANLISRLCRLEELYMGESFHGWAIEGMVEDTSKACLSELTSLSLLTTLCVQVPNPESVPRHLHMPNLQKFEITIGKGYDSLQCYPKSRRLSLREIKTSIPEAVKGMLQTTEDLTLFCLYDEMVRSILDANQGGLNNLKYLKVFACKETSLLISMPAFLSALESLHIRLMDELSFIGLVGSLPKLKILRIEHCCSIFTAVWPSLIKGLPSLEEVEVVWCKKMMHIFNLDNITSESQQNLLSNLRSMRLSGLETLTSIWRWKKAEPLTSPVSLKNLTVVIVHSCRNLDIIFPYFIAANLPQLEVLEIKWCNELKSIVEKRPGVSENEYQLSCFQSLKIIEVEGCSTLRNLFSVGEARNLHQLKKITVRSCNGLVKLISHEEEEEEKEDKSITLPELCSIEIKDVSNIDRLCAKPFSVDLPSLEALVLEKCPTMEKFTSDLQKYGIGNSPKLRIGQ